MAACACNLGRCSVVQAELGLGDLSWDHIRLIKDKGIPGQVLIETQGLLQKSLVLFVLIFLERPIKWPRQA